MQAPRQPQPGDPPLHGHASSTGQSAPTDSTGSTGSGTSIDKQIDPYAVLGVNPRATDAELDQAFRTLVRRHHPDTRLPDTSPAAADAADRRFQQLLNAYATLRNPTSRANYDQQRTTNRASQRATQPSDTASPSTGHLGPPDPPWPRSRPGAVNPPVGPTPAIRVGPVRWRRPHHGD
jgi:hypothetical protein